MNHPVTMALLLVKELRKLDLLEEVILANDIGCLRVCAHCGKLMNTGWSSCGRSSSQAYLGTLL